MAQASSKIFPLTRKAHSEESISAMSGKCSSRNCLPLTGLPERQGGGGAKQ
jgi:hypothetical protein